MKKADVKARGSDDLAAIKFDMPALARFTTDGLLQCIEHVVVKHQQSVLEVMRELKEENIALKADRDMLRDALEGITKVAEQLQDKMRGKQWHALEDARHVLALTKPVRTRAKG